MFGNCHIYCWGYEAKMCKGDAAMAKWDTTQQTLDMQTNYSNNSNTQKLPLNPQKQT